MRTVFFLTCTFPNCFSIADVECVQGRGVAMPEEELLLWFGSMAVVTYLVRIETRNARACAHHLLQGQKDSASFNPSGLLATSTSEHGEGVIFVALNYRLGLFGWLNGQGDKDIFPNTALQDQVKKYIHLFGGDPDRVTVFGESAGGGSIMHHITGNRHSTVPFERAIIQSPGWLTSLPVAQIWNQTLSAASTRAGRPITNGTDLVTLDYPTLLRVNSDIVYKSNYGDFGYGPTVDGGYVPAFPGVSLLKGDFDNSVELMLGHNSHESDIFTSPLIDSREKIVTKLRSSIYGITDSAIEHILTVLYPPPRQTDLYTTEYGRAALMLSEYTFVCNTRYLATSFKNATWNYRFEVPPGNHAQDLAYTFHKPGDANVISRLAVQMQTYFTKFAASSNPNEPGSAPKWQQYGKSARIATFGSDGVGTATDDAKNDRCIYWQRGTYTTQQ
ncbi:alpha/beta-Hydrolase [Purpureocillium lilacinum]|uniref:Carboxylic ester hydrolase n=1 Tax=Purpureocillium lilacinum TaxID=33203 RepID=A0A179GJ11_PURLI|nr:alpha/beta-Hydrolase [Purpureocillium lilacinum]